MTEDTRVCPICKKFPPVGQVWKDFEGHVTVCAQKFYEVNQEEINQLLETKTLYIAVLGQGLPPLAVSTDLIGLTDLNPTL
jgi:hypothetical protein